MTATERAPLTLVEEDVKARVEGGDLRGAMKVIEREHSVAIARFLAARVATAADADDAFQEWVICALSKLPTFRWESSLRTFLFWCARTALKIVRTRVRGAVGGNVDESDASLEIAQSVNTNTLHLLREEDRERARLLRESLSDDEREVLSLYVDLELPWNEVVAIVLGEDCQLDELERTLNHLKQQWNNVRGGRVDGNEEQVQLEQEMERVNQELERFIRERDRLKQIFHRAKEKLRSRAVEAGFTRPIEEARAIIREGVHRGKRKN